MSTLDVWLHGVRVGALEQFEDEQYVFAFDADWLADPERPVLGQFFEDRRPEDVVLWGPPCWFAHLLPQGPLRRAVARQSDVEEGDVFALLQRLGEDLPGAVVLRPGASRLSRPVAQAPTSLPSAGPLRFSLAGAQWKLSLRAGERGLVVPVQGQSGRWIAKFHDPTYRELPRVEFATMEWARASGVDVPTLRLGHVSEVIDLPAGVPVGDGTIYLIERFDRGPDEARIHMEDLGQVLDRPPGAAQYSGSYELVAAVLAEVVPRGDLRAFCERLVFCVLSGNTDAHLKNWSVVYEGGRWPRLSPAYDLVATVVYLDDVPELADELALELAGSKRFEAVQVGSFHRLADHCGVSFDEVAGWVREAADRVRGAWAGHAARWPFTTRERAALARHLGRVPLR